MSVDFEAYLNPVEELLEGGLITVVLSNVPARMVDLAIYIFTALSLYTIARRRGITKAWLAWIPFINVWAIGCISDQYQKAENGKRTRRRSTLLYLNIVRYILTAMLVVAALLALGEIFLMIFTGAGSAEALSAEILKRLSEALPLFALIGLLSLPLLVVSISYLVLYFMSLHDIYKSFDPDAATLFTVLSIFFNILPPVFLFLCREKDLGMPIRHACSEEPWEHA